MLLMTVQDNSHLEIKIWTALKSKYLSSNKFQRLCVPRRNWRNYSDCLDSIEMPCQFLYSDKGPGSFLYSAWRFAASGFGVYFPFLLKKSTYSLANTLAHERRHTPPCREAKESRICCPHGKTGPSGRWHTAQTAQQGSTQRSLATEELR